MNPELCEHDDHVIRHIDLRLLVDELFLSHTLNHVKITSFSLGASLLDVR